MHCSLDEQHHARLQLGPPDPEANLIVSHTWGSCIMPQHTHDACALLAFCSPGERHRHADAELKAMSQHDEQRDCTWLLAVHVSDDLTEICAYCGSSEHA